MARVLVVGADGLIGADLARHLSVLGWSVIGTSRRPVSSTGSILNLDLANDDPGNWPLPEVDLVVFAAAISRFADCRAQPILTRQVNVVSPVILARRLVAAGARVILLSTSAVFDGSRPLMSADETRRPTSPYGTLKAEAEDSFLSLGSQGAVVRLTKVLNPVHPLIANWIADLRSGTRVEAFDDLYMAPIGLSDVRAGVLAAARAGGVVQVSGHRDVSYRDVLDHIVRRLGIAPGLVCTSSAAEYGIPPGERPVYTSLDAERLTATGWHPPDPFALIDHLYFGQSSSAASRMPK